ncbi:MAG: amidohydrolase family protein [Syntrophomonadaceae bacterium]|nr:amidohydrolase family protein [Syntrophomonadaceae bacterium]
MQVLDSHAHSGHTLSFKILEALWRDAGITGGALIPPVEEIYDRYDWGFIDSPFYQDSRVKVHAYLKSLRSDQIFTYWFVWNDFALPEAGFSGVKWHRHSNEPKYKYDSEACYQFIEQICAQRLPVMIEDEFHYTQELLKRINGRTAVIIPHFGGLNGGYERLKRAGVFDNPQVYVDTALASPYELMDFARDYGVDRILFGSDYPFGDPGSERYKVEQVFTTGEELEKVLALNLLKLMERSGKKEA